MPPGGAERAGEIAAGKRSLPRVQVEIPTESADRCGSFYGEVRPRCSYMDYCLLPWSPPASGTYLRIAEPPQAALPPWGPIKFGPERPSAQELCRPPRALPEHEVTPDIDAAMAACFVGPRFPVSSPPPQCPAFPQPPIYGSPLAVVRPDYRGKPSNQPNLCNCLCDCLPVLTEGGRAAEAVVAGVQVDVFDGAAVAADERDKEAAGAAALEPPQVQGVPQAACVTPVAGYWRDMASGVGTPASDRNRDEPPSLVSCAQRVIVPPVHPELADGYLDVVAGTADLWAVSPQPAGAASRRIGATPTVAPARSGESPAPTSTRTVEEPEARPVGQLGQDHDAEFARAESMSGTEMQRTLQEPSRGQE